MSSWHSYTLHPKHRLTISDLCLVLAQDIAETLATDTQQERLPRPPASTNATQEETLWLQLLAKMTGHVVVHLPNIWQLVQVSTRPRASQQACL